MKKEFTSPLESATRKLIDEILKNLNWKTDEFGKECNVFTERVRTSEERQKIKNKFSNGKFPDYVLYSSDNFEPIAVIEAKRPGQNLQKALDQAKDYADCLGIKIIFAVDGSIIEARDTTKNTRLKSDGLLITELISEKLLLRFIEEGAEIVSPQNITHTKNELIEIFSFANDLLRQEGMREGVERFTEFSNLLFLKLVDEIEEDRDKKGEKRRLEKRYCWSSFNKKPAKELMDYINDTVLPKLVNKYNGSGDVFNKELAIKNEIILKKIVDKLSELTLSNTDSDVKGDAFEYFLKNSITVGNDLGEYFTPRHIVKLVVDLVDPNFGETIYDPCCGTGGFLIEAFRHIRKKVKPTKENMNFLENKTIYGRELTGTAKIAKMNMILAGDGHTNIRQMDSLSEPVKEKYDVVLTNYPFSQKTQFANLYGLNTIEGNPVFLKHIIDALKDGGRAGIVVPDGVLFGKGNDYIKVRKLLVETCNVKAVIQLDTAVFRPYTAQPTSILIFEKKKQTNKIWFFEVIEDGFKKTTSKKGRPPIKKDDIPILRSLWNDKQETERSFFADFNKIKNHPRNDYKLFMNYHKPRREIKNPKELGEICEEFVLGGTPAKKNREYYGGKNLWVNISDMKSKTIEDTQFKLSDKGKEYLKSKEIKKGTLLMSFKLTLGKTAFAGKDLFTNEAICGLIPKDKTDENFGEYLYYVLPLVNYTPYAQRASKGLTLNKDLLSTVEVPFPSKSERERIIKSLKGMVEELKVKKKEFEKDIEKRENAINDFMESIIN
jgi:type I restriction enzyme M protein